MSVYKNFGLSAILVAATMLVSGCAEEKPVANEEGDGASSTSTVAVRDHSGWWCVEHAIPEAECSMCSSKVAKECKAKGDWCEEHNRAESQCFICKPELAEKYVALYEAKEGKKPPAAIE